LVTKNISEMQCWERLCLENVHGGSFESNENMVRQFNLKTKIKTATHGIVGTQGSNFCLHRDILGYATINVLVKGGTKIWYINPPSKRK